MGNLLEQFDTLFAGLAKADIVNRRLEINIGSLTMAVSLSEHVGRFNDPMV